MHPPSGCQVLSVGFLTIEKFFFLHFISWFRCITVISHIWTLLFLFIVFLFTTHFFSTHISLYLWVSLDFIYLIFLFYYYFFLRFCFGCFFFRKKRALSDWLIAPNTKWCGRGQTADKYSQLGGASKADKCCRRHDHCKFNIYAMTTKWRLFNYRPFTISHCSCDMRLVTHFYFVWATRESQSENLANQKTADNNLSKNGIVANIFDNLPIQTRIAVDKTLFVDKKACRFNQFYQRSFLKCDNWTLNKFLSQYSEIQCKISERSNK